MSLSSTSTLFLKTYWYGGSTTLCNLFLLSSFPATLKPSREAAGITLLFWYVCCWSTELVVPIISTWHTKFKALWLWLWLWVGRREKCCRAHVPISWHLCNRPLGVEQMRNRNTLITYWGEFRDRRQALERPQINYSLRSSAYNIIVFIWYTIATLNSVFWIKSFSRSLSFKASPHLLLWKCKTTGEKISSQHKFITYFLLLGLKQCYSYFIPDIGEIYLMEYLRFSWKRNNNFVSAFFCIKDCSFFVIIFAFPLCSILSSKGSKTQSYPVRQRNSVWVLLACHPRGGGLVMG